VISSLKSINAQNDLIKGKIYSDFINQLVYTHDTTFQKNSELIFLSCIKKIDSKSNFNFGKQFIQDSSFGYMIMKLDTIIQEKYNFHKKGHIQTNYRIKFSNIKIPLGSIAWEKFHRKNNNCFGILKLSDIVISNDGETALFYSEYYHYFLFASGDLIFMEKTDNGWRILQYINIWIS